MIDMMIKMILIGIKVCLVGMLRINDKVIILVLLVKLMLILLICVFMKMKRRIIVSLI